MSGCELNYLVINEKKMGYTKSIMNEIQLQGDNNASTFFHCVIIVNFLFLWVKINEFTSSTR